MQKKFKDIYLFLLERLMIKESCNLIGQDLFSDVTCAFVHKIYDTFFPFIKLFWSYSTPQMIQKNFWVWLGRATSTNKSKQDWVRLGTPSQIKPKVAASDATFSWWLPPLKNYDINWFLWDINDQKTLQSDCTRAFRQ